MIGAGAATLTVHLWASTTHTWNGINYADVWHNELLVVGVGLVIGGLLLVVGRFVVGNLLLFRQAKASTTNQAG